MKMIGDFKKLIGSLQLKTLLRGLKKKKQRVIAFELYFMGELQFFREILCLFAERNPNDAILIIHHAETMTEFDRQLPQLRDRVFHTSIDYLRKMDLPEIDLFLTSEQHCYGLSGAYSVALFHGQPSKGLTLTSKIVNSFDAFFLYGPLQRETVENFIEESLPQFPPHLELFDIGYSKSDALLNGKYNAAKTLQSLHLDETNKTLLYAPAFNEGASLREYGLEIIRELAAMARVNVIVKLPINCRMPTTDLYATGGVNWFDVIRPLQNEFPNLRLSEDFEIDPLLACSDVLITCVSSVGLEFLALNKPVVFIETPKFYTSFLKKRIPEKDTSRWGKRTVVNGGKEFGLVVNHPAELPAAIERVLREPENFPRQQDRLKTYLLYNPGRATQVAVEKIEALLEAKKRTRRPSTVRGIGWELLASVKERFRSWAPTNLFRPTVRP